MGIGILDANRGLLLLLPQQGHEGSHVLHWLAVKFHNATRRQPMAAGRGAALQKSQRQHHWEGKKGEIGPMKGHSICCNRINAGDS